ncbi:kinesin [Chloropicon primus]|uniref:Kinesin-like protein n=2 Tax=Chloropicon primus TaxID=1764295 RepID=A0A5B8MR14_9CHLO|nr:kinesin [Chloropicon primus]|eukprot:QDZ21830.1 kinesin [Chloropicon primus]
MLYSLSVEGMRETTAQESRMRRKEAAEFVREAIGVEVPAEDDAAFCESLRSGEVLCRLLNVQVYRQTAQPAEALPKTYNFDNFFDGCLSVGLERDDLFHLADLDAARGHPVVNTILRLRSLWNAEREPGEVGTSGSSKSSLNMTPLRSEVSGDDCGDVKTPGFQTPGLPESLPLARASAIKNAKGRGVQAAVSVTRLMQQCTNLLNATMGSSPLSISPASAGSVSPERTVETLGPVIESVLSSLTSEYERRLLKKETELKRLRASLEQSKKAAAESLENGERVAEMKRDAEEKAAAETERAKAEAELEDVRKDRQETNARVLAKVKALKGEASEAKKICKSIKMDASLAFTAFQIELSQLQHHIEPMYAVVKDYSTIQAENARLNNEILDLKGNIRVYTRVRPPGATGSTEASIVNVDCTSDFDKDKIWLSEGSNTNFAFEKVFDESSTQEKVWNEISPFVQSALDGYNVCLFAYGQTGSGKTHTMTGNQGAERGVNTRVVEDLFRNIERSSATHDFDVSIQMLEIYNEQLRDLLDDQKKDKKLEIRGSSADAGGSGVDVPGLTVMSVSDIPEVMALMEKGHENRSIGATKMNERSSRSHSVFTINVTSSNRLNGVETHAKVNLIDLAGSERVGRSQATGERLKEAQSINKSLSALGDVIQALASKKKKHVPFRNSKLTHLLAESMSGSSKVLMLSHIAPEKDNASETVSTLRFATRVATCELGQAKKNQTNTSAKDAEIERLRSRVRKQSDENKRLSVEKRPASAVARKSAAAVPTRRPLSAANFKSSSPEKPKWS